MPPGRQLGLDHGGGACEPGVDVSELGVEIGHEVAEGEQRLRAAVRLEVEAHRQRLDVGGDELGRILSDVRVSSHDNGDRFADVADPVDGEHGLEVGHDPFVVDTQAE